MRVFTTSHGSADTHHSVPYCPEADIKKFELERVSKGYLLTVVNLGDRLGAWGHFWRPLEGES